MHQEYCKHLQKVKREGYVDKTVIRETITIKDLIHQTESKADQIV